MTTNTLNLGTYRNNPRLWIEGNQLASNGWQAGDRYTPVFTASNIVIHKQNDGKRKVSGNESRPIIELTGKYMLPLFEHSKRAQIIIESDFITITPIK